jgi:hypothetical protein
MKRILIAISLALLAIPAIACDKTSSQKVQSMLHDMGTWYEKDGVTTFKWGSDWDELAPHERKKMITVFADSDACLSGRAREIRFYRKGRLVGQASPNSGISLID